MDFDAQSLIWMLFPPWWLVTCDLGLDLRNLW